jgi:hypothetical protein
MKGNREGWQKIWLGFSSIDGASNNDAIKGELDHKRSEECDTINNTWPDRS